MSISITTAEQVTNFAFSIGSMAFSKKPFLTTTTAVTMIRIGFVVSTLLQILAYLYIRQKIVATNNQQKFRYKNPAPLQDDEIEVVTFDYDMAECNKALKGMLFQVLITSFIHYKWKGVQPVLIQALGIIKPILFSGLFREYIYGIKMQRPFEKNKVFGGHDEIKVEELRSSKKKEE